MASSIYICIIYKSSFFPSVSLAYDSSIVAPALGSWLERSPALLSHFWSVFSLLSCCMLPPACELLLSEERLLPPSLAAMIGILLAACLWPELWPTVYRDNGRGL